ncbi:MAG: SdpI family protein [Clostridia bacterium]|nr:SdpI family protein [Clostridia bacterium]
MGYLVYMTLVCVLIPITMLVIGIIFIKKPPRSINSIYGYRTDYSMKNQDTWDFAHKYIGRIWAVLGLVLLVLFTATSILVYMFFYERFDDICGLLCLLGVAGLIVPIIPTEIALKKTFDKNGNKK